MALHHVRVFAISVPFEWRSLPMNLFHCMQLAFLRPPRPQVDIQRAAPPRGREPFHGLTRSGAVVRRSSDHRAFAAVPREFEDTAPGLYV